MMSKLIALLFQVCSTRDSRVVVSVVLPEIVKW